MLEFIFEGQSIEFGGYSFDNAAHDAGLMFKISNPNGAWKQHRFEPQKYTWIDSKKEARKIAKLKARKMFVVYFEMWHAYSLDNLKQQTFAFTLEEAHQRMRKRAEAFGESGDYKVIKITETNEYDICN